MYYERAGITPTFVETKEDNTKGLMQITTHYLMKLKSI